MGGGYEFSGDPLVPHHVFQTQATADFGGWQLGSIYGHATGAPGAVEAWAACIQAPRAEFVVHITEPSDGTIVGPSGAGGGQTNPVTFTAVAVNADGNAASGVTFEWTDNGAAMGSGSNISAPLSAQTCAQGEGFITHDIVVTGTNANGDTSTDAITVRAGQIC